MLVGVATHTSGSQHNPPMARQKQQQQQQQQEEEAERLANGNISSSSSSRRKPPALASAVSGSLAGALISACVQPLDVLRTRMQADAALGASKGVVPTLHTVLREGGVRGLWRGTGPTVVRLAVGAGINFVALEHLKHSMLTALPHASGQLGFMQAAAVGGLARAVSAAVMSPVTLVKTRMEYGGPSHVTYRNTAHALATIARVEGPRALFRGMGPTVLTNAPFSALYFMLYTKLKHSLEAATAASSMGRGGGSMHSSSSGGGLHDSSSSSSGSWSSVAVNFVSGVVAATAATLLTQPSDVVRTRMQLGLPGAANGDALSTLGHVLRSSGGAHALLAGAAPRVLKRTLQTALVWTLYEELVPRLSALYHVALAQQAAEQEAQQGAESQQQPSKQRRR